MVNEDDEIPPLEDLSEEITRKFNIKQKTKASFLEVDSDYEIQKRREKQMKDLIVTKPTSKKDCDIETKSSLKNTSNQTYCGFKKGFLINGKNSEKKKTKCKEKIIEIKPSEDAKNNKVLPEVQQAMEGNIPLLHSTDWVTDNLLEKVTKNPKLAKQFADPNFNEAIQLFQSNPQKVMEMCQNNKELREFIQEFCALMGDHFTKLGEKQKRVQSGVGASTAKSPASKEDEAKMQTIISNPEVATILQNPDIQKLLTALKKNPASGQRMLKSADLSLRCKIQKLIDVGLLQFTSG